MSVQQSPIVSEFATAELEASHDQWFRAKVEEALRSEKPRLSHDAAMTKVQAMLDERRKARAKPPVV
ncbi:stability determinant [Rhodoferax lacus]|uniref:Stability determinant n=1 Tax=Rhodoferax lacus TaxID=2184758 RepID=A0A3E1R9X7_9BURK|nr:stability determinant [Rhodoferax lacus]RFO96169.1 stability determinant [Rhodoferax lacus]